MTPGSHRTRHDFSTFEALEERLLLSASAYDPIEPLGHHDHDCDHGAADCHGGFSTPDDDFGNDAASANRIQVDSTIFGDIEGILDQDWFIFTGLSGLDYTFESEAFSLTDTQMTLYDTDGIAVLDFDDDSGTGFAAKITWTAPADGDYYVAIQAFELLTGTYSMHMSDNAVPTGEIRGSKWNDINQDGIRDAGEPGLEGWVIFIDSNNNRQREPQEQFTITDANGDYVLSGLRPGPYTIAEKIKPGWSQTFPGEDGAGGEEVVVGNSGPVEFNLGTKWPQPNGPGSTVTIEYSYSNLLDGGIGGPGALISINEITSAIEEALELWATYAPFKFVEVPDSGPLPDNGDSNYPAASHPLIRFGHHFIDGNNGTLAHAYLPDTFGLAGDVHFDNGEIWRIGPGDIGIDLLEVAVHEIGHALGLLHEPLNGEEAIMNPIYRERYNGLGTAFLFEDDILGIQALYGELTSLAGAWNVVLASRGDVVTNVDFGNFLNDDFGDGVDGSTTLAVNTTQSGLIESFGDEDWFSVELEQYVAYSFGAYLDGIDDTVITLYDQQGNIILSTDDDGGPGLGSLATWTATESGTYYVEVKGFKNSIGGYQMQVIGLAGDADGDRFVGLDDLTLILNNWNNSVPVGDMLMGDLNQDGFVGLDDLDLVLGNWNVGAPNPPAASLSVAAAVTASSTSAQAPQAVSLQTASQPIGSAQTTTVYNDTTETQSALAAWWQGQQTDQPAASEDEEGLLGLWDGQDQA